MLGSLNFDKKHFIVLLFVALTFGCSSISVERFYSDNDSNEEINETANSDNTTKTMESDEKEISNSIPLIKESDYTDDISADDITMVEASGNTDKSVIKPDSWKMDNVCPQQFHDVNIPSNGKYCQTFAAELPASLVFFVPMQPSEAVQFFVDKNENFNIKQQVQNRILLSNSDNSKTLIVSPDGVGSQVDILVKR